MLSTTYHLGGYQPAAPAQNKAEQWDSVAGNYTRWNAAGVQQEARTLTAAESSALADADAVSTRSSNAASLRTKLQAAIDANATYLAVVAPTNAQVVAQVARLTREATGLMRLALNATDTTDGT